MKKLIPFAALLALAMAFSGCSTGETEKTDGKTVALQDALNEGGTVNLDDYTLSKNSYTVSKAVTITGNAKNRNFVIADGASVTFDGTQNIGTVTVGSPDSAPRSAARAAGAGVTITLRSEGVKISKIFIHVDCSFDSDSEKNSFGDVVVGANVQTLTLKGETAVAALVSAGEAQVAITVSAEVKIEKADEAIIAAVQASNPNVTISIPTISEDNLKDLQDAFEDSKKSEPELDDSNIIDSRDDLAKCVYNIIKEYYDFARKVEQQNEARTVAPGDKDSLVKFLKEFFKFGIAMHYDEGDYDSDGNWIEKNPPDMGILYKLFSGRGNEITEDFHSEFNLDLKNIGVNEGLDAFIEAYNKALTDVAAADKQHLPNNGEPLSKETLFGSNTETVNAFLDVANSYASVPKLHAVGKFDVNANDANNFASGNASIAVQVKANRINSLIPELFREYNNHVGRTYIPANVNLPVTAVDLSITVDAGAVFSKEQFEQFVQLCKNAPRFDRDEPSYAAFTFREQKEGESYEDYRQQYNAAYQEWWNDYQKRLDEYDAAEEEYYKEYGETLKQYFSNATTYPTPKDYKCNIGTSVSATVASRETVPGGIITVSFDGDCSLKQITTLLGAGPYVLDNIDKLNYGDNLKELNTVYGITPTVTVTDSNGKQTFKGNIDDIIYVIDYIVEHIGGIIQ